MSYEMSRMIAEKEKARQTIYCGSGKKKSATWLQVSVNIDKIQDHIQELNGVKFVRLNINLKDAPDQFGKDVSLSVDNFKPEKDKMPF